MTAPDEGVAPAADLAPDDGVARRVVNGGVIRTGGFAITNLIALVSAMILARYLGPEDMGPYGSVMALVTIIYGITDGGLSIVGSRELALKEPGEARRHLTAVLLGIRTVLSVVGLLLAIAVAVVLNFSDTMIIGTALAGAGGIATAAFAALTLPALVELRNLRLLSVEVTRQLVQLVGTVLCVWAGYGLLAFFGVQALIGPIVLLLLPLLIGRGVLMLPRYDRAEWVHMVRVALPIAVAGVLSIMYLKVIVLIGSVTLSDYDQGLLVLCTRAVEILSGLPMLIVAVALPVVSVAARDDRARLRYVSQRLLESSVILGIFLSLPLSFGAATALRILGGDEYLGATEALQIQAWMLLTVFVVQGCIVLLIALHRHRAIVTSNVIGLVCVIVAGAVLLPTYGVVGGAAAVVIADLILMTVTLGFLTSGEFRGELQLGAIPRILLAALIAIAIGLATPGSDVLAAVTATLSFAVLLLVLRAAPPEARALLRRSRAAPLR